MSRLPTKKPAHASAGLLTVTMFLLSLAITACGGTAASPSPATATTQEQASSVTTAGRSSGYQEVAFASTDGLQISGRLYGTGTKYVILSHMYPADQTSWQPEAQSLADRGYAALTFDFRGYGASEGDKDISKIALDLEGAFKYAQTAGATEVIFVGASMGGTASLIAAAEFQVLSSVRVAGVVTLSAPVEFQGLSARAAVPTIEVPMLLIAAEDDVGAAQARQLQELSGGRARLEILPGSDHGTDLFAGPQVEEVRALLLGFLQENMPAD